MYWNADVKAYNDEPVLININMRCIEIWNSMVAGDSKGRLTLTWDVLKYGS